MNLYELTANYQHIQDLIEQGEDLEEVLGTLDAELESKAEGYVRVIRNTEAQIEAFKAEEKRIAENRRKLENGKDRMKQALFDSMKKTGKDKIKAGVFQLAIQKNGGKAPVILDVPEDSLPEQFYTKTVNKKAISDYIEETGDMSYAHFGDRGESLRIK